MGVRLYDKLILVCSEDSLASYWVDREVTTAMAEEEALWRERGERILKIIPVALDDSWQTWEGARATSLRERRVEDFSGWQDNEESYAGAFERLLKALEPGSKIPPPEGKL